MLLKTRVKVSGINNLSDARYCAGMGVDFLGFSPEPDSNNYTELSRYKEITNWLSGPKYIGELTKSPEDNLVEYRFDALQTNDENLISELKKEDKPLFFSFKIHQISDIEIFTKIAEKYKTEIQYFLIQSDTMNYTECMHELKSICTEFPVILDFQKVTADNVENLLQQISPQGIGLRGGNEISPGLKDFEGLADILEALEEI